MKQGLIRALTIALAALASPALAGPIADHRAIYTMTLASSGPGSGVQGASGEMALDVRGQCDTVTVNQRFKSDFWGSDGKPKHTELAISSLEAADGASFEFSLHNEVDGVIAEDFKGKATRGQGGHDGTIAYDAAAFPTAVLPGEAIFPTEHMKALLAAAEAGKSALSVLIFDGAEKGKIYHASALIGRKSEGGAPPKGLEALAGLAHWPVSISYFPTNSSEPLPEYETSFELYANGVSGTLSIDYGDFALRGDLAALQLMPKVDCSKP